MEDCPLSNPDNFEKDSSFLVLKAAVADAVMKQCGLCLKYSHCQPDFQLLPNTGCYTMETLESELGGIVYLDDDDI
jgi:hypothetical protein